MRLCSVWMFCLSANSWVRFCASGLMVAVSRNSPPSADSASARSDIWSSMSLRALSRVSASRNLITIPLGSRAMPLWRMFLSRSCERTSPASDSSRLVSAAFMSTCSRKCTPPRRSSPRYMGSAPMAVSQRGELDSRLSATV